MARVFQRPGARVNGGHGRQWETGRSLPILDFMFSPLTAHILIIVVVALSIVLMLTRPRRISEVYWIGAGALLLVALRLIPLQLAGRAIAEGTDVYLFLTGMMLLSEVARLFGVFDWVASVAVEHARGSCMRLFTLIYLAGTVVTILMSNDATAVVLTPAVFSAVRRSKAEPLPNLFACAFIANAASFVLPISNPANLVVFRTQMPPLANWIAAFGLPSILSIASTYLILRWYFRRDLTCALPRDQQPTRLTGNGRLVLIGIVLTAVVLLVASAMKQDLGLPTCICAIVVSAIVLIRARTNPIYVIRDISWGVLPLVGGLFILVEAIDSIGAMRLSAAAMQWAEKLPPISGAMLTAGVVGIGNNLVNNLPLGLIAGSTLKLTGAHGLIANAVLIAVDLGPNLSVTGSLATILWLIALRREGVHVDFRDFLKAGAIAMPIALALAVAGAVAVNAL
jgi:arsenical pump membrane protein